MPESIKYSCLIDGYTSRDLLSGSTLKSIKDDLTQVILACEIVVKQTPILTVEKSNEVITSLNNTFYMFFALFVPFKSFVEQEKIKYDFRDLPIMSKINQLREMMETYG